MLKAFSILWLAIFIPLIFLVMPTGFGPVSYLSERMMYRFYTQVYDDTLRIIHQELTELPQAHWPGHIDQLSEHFGSQLKLVTMGDYQHDSEAQALLAAGELAMDYNDPVALLKRIEHSDWVLYYAMNLSQAELVATQSQGALYILRRSLLRLPPEQWATYLSSVSENRPFDARLVEINDVPLTNQELRRLNNDKVVGHVQQNGGMLLYTRLNDQYLVGILDVHSQHSQQQLQTTLIGLFVVTISGALLLWLFPLWRDLRRLAKTAGEFGEGRLNQRGKLSRLSVVAQLGSAFNTMADNIEKLINGHRELTNAIAHDLRTPLYRLRFAFEMLSNDGISHDQKENYQKIINNSIDDLDHLINQTLVLSRYSMNSQTSQIQHCPLPALLKRELSMFADEWPELDVNLTCPDSPPDQTIAIDQRAMLRALNNLLNNASRFARSQIRVRLYRQDTHWILVVEDDGPGIPESMHARIFDPFTQVDNQQRDTRQGHGLGLAIVRQIVLLHQGDVTLDRSSLGGARFTLRWPAALSPQSTSGDHKTATSIQQP